MTETSHPWIPITWQPLRATWFASQVTLRSLAAGLANSSLPRSGPSTLQASAFPEPNSYLDSGADH